MEILKRFIKRQGLDKSPKVCYKVGIHTKEIKQVGRGL